VALFPEKTWRYDSRTVRLSRNVKGNANKSNILLRENEKGRFTMKRNVSKLRLAVFLLVVMAMVLGVSMTVSAEMKDYVVTKGAPLRKEPNKNSGVRIRINAGRTVEADFETKTNKYVFAKYNGVSGWFLAGYLSPKSSGSNRTTVERCTLRTGPDFDAEAIMNIPKGSTVTVKEPRGSWYKVKYDGRTGYIPAEALDRTPSSGGTYYRTTDREGKNTRMHKYPVTGDVAVTVKIPPNTLVKVYGIDPYRMRDGRQLRFADAYWNGYRGFIAASELTKVN
jgi:SH3-like domain-containing protein